MKQIEVFVDSVYRNVGGNKKEIQELKTEMKNHLLEAVHELKAEGKTEREAIDIAIERFGGEREMRAIVGQLFKAQKTFAQWILYCAVTFLVLSLSIFSFLWQNAESDASELSDIATQISDELENKEVITQEMEAEIERLVESTDQISVVKIFNVTDLKIDATTGKGYENVFNYVKQAQPDYQYTREHLWAPEWLLPDFYPYGTGDDQWYVDMEHRSFGDFAALILLVGVAIYWTLFSIWTIINAYHNKRLNIGWVLAFIIFNVLGYLVYKLSQQITRNLN